MAPQKKPELGWHFFFQKGKRLFGVGFLVGDSKAPQAEFRSSRMAARGSGLSRAMHSAHSPPEVRTCELR